MSDLYCGEDGCAGVIKRIGAGDESLNYCEDCQTIEGSVIDINSDDGLGVNLDKLTETGGFYIE